MKNPFKIENFLPKKEQLLPKNFIIGLLALLSTSTMSFSKETKDIIKDAEKKIESMTTDSRRDYVKNMYLELDNGFLQDSVENAEIGSITLDDNAETNIDYFAEGKSKILSINKTVANLPDNSDSNKVFSEQEEKAFIKEAKTLFLKSSENKNLFPETTKQQQEDGINSYDAYLNFYDIDGSGSIDAFSLEMFGEDILFSLVDKSEFVQKLKDLNLNTKEGKKQLRDAFLKLKDPKFLNGNVVVTDPKYVKLINEKYAEYLKILRDSVKETSENE